MPDASMSFNVFESPQRELEDEQSLVHPPTHVGGSWDTALWAHKNVLGSIKSLAPWRFAVNGANGNMAAFLLAGLSALSLCPTNVSEIL